MGFLTNLFGGEANIWTVGFALIIVIVLIVAGVWVLKLLFNASGSIVRGRQRRLAMIDTMAIDNKHNLVLVRRDNVEHLLLVSNTGELLVESGIAVPELNSGQSANSMYVAPAPTPQTQNQTGANAPETRSTADRLGLARLLRRNKAPAVSAVGGTSGKKDNGTDDAPRSDDPLARLAALGTSTNQTPDKDSGPALRHKGLLKPVSEMVGAVSIVQNNTTQDNYKPSNNDSAMNEAQQIDADAMESIEEGAVPSNDGDKETKPENKSGQEKSES